MVKEYGMSPLGPIVFGEREEMAFLGKEFDDQRNYSEEIAAKIDEQVAQIIDNGVKMASKILEEKRATLDKIASRLMEKETIEKEEYEQLIGITFEKK